MGQLLEEVVRWGQERRSVEGLNIKGKTGTAETGTGHPTAGLGAMLKTLTVEIYLLLSWLKKAEIEVRQLLL